MEGARDLRSEVERRVHRDLRARSARQGIRSFTVTITSGAARSEAADGIAGYPLRARAVARRLGEGRAAADRGRKVCERGARRDGPARRRARRRRAARHAERAQPWLSARHGRAHRISRPRSRQFLELARAHVSLRGAHDAGGCRGDHRAELRGHARGRLHARRRISLRASRRRRQGRTRTPPRWPTRIAAAAAGTGIALTLLPVFYAHGNFGGAAPTDGQRRFVCSLEQYARLLEACRVMVRGWPMRVSASRRTACAP